LRSIREPIIDEAKDRVEEEEGGTEKVGATIWQAMGEVASISQTTVSRSGVMLRFEAIRTESNKISHHPSEPYQDRNQIGRQGRAWPQTMMFFVRTQRRHQWKSRSYRFNQRQKRAFERFIALAQQSVDECDGEDRSDQSRESRESSDEGADGDRDRYVTRKSPTMQPMSELQQACLSFCIELLNQTIHNREYDMALVCALAA